MTPSTFTQPPLSTLPPRTTSWLGHYRPQKDAGLRLICLHYAGGSAGLYRQWQDRLGPETEVCAVELPGRGLRFAEPLIADMDTLVSRLGAALEPLAREPYAVFGHSMGALLGYALLRSLSETGSPPPLSFVAAGRHPPHRPAPVPAAHHLDDAGLIRRLKALEATPPDILAHPDFIQTFLPIVRADFTLNETYRWREAGRLACPIYVLGGTRDREAPPEGLEAWGELTAGATEVHIFEEGHFFVQSLEPAVVDLTARLIRNGAASQARPRR